MWGERGRVSGGRAAFLRAGTDLVRDESRRSGRDRESVGRPEPLARGRGTDLATALPQLSHENLRLAASRGVSQAFRRRLRFFLPSSSISLSVSAMVAGAGS